MLAGRFLPIVLVLAIAGSLARKQPVPVSAGTFPTGTPLFAGLLVGVVLIVVGLTYFPVLALGPILEHLGLDAAQRAPIAARPRHRAARAARQRREARSAADGEQPGDVRGRARQRARHGLFLKDFNNSSTQENVFAGLVAAWLWFTVLFANFAEAIAEGRGKAQAEELRKTRAETVAHRRRPTGRSKTSRAQPRASATRSSSPPAR